MPALAGVVLAAVGFVRAWENGISPGKKLFCVADILDISRLFILMLACAAGSGDQWTNK